MAEHEHARRAVLLLLCVGVVAGARAQTMAKAEASLAGAFDLADTEEYHEAGEQEEEEEETRNPLRFIRELKNLTKEAGDRATVKCEVTGEPPASRFRWFFNEAPLYEEAGRVKVKTSLKGASSQVSVLRILQLEALDKGYYRCEASNGLATVKSTAVINVVLGSGRRGQKQDSSEDYLHLPDHRSYQDPFSGLNSLSNGIEGLPDHLVEFGDTGRGGGGLNLASNGAISQSFVSGRRPGEVGPGAGQQLPSLKPDERSGRCQAYAGTACREWLGEAAVWVSHDQSYVDEKLSLTFATITASKLMSPRCAQFAIQAICLSTFPLCDPRTLRPRRLCREECEVLEADYCRAELETARSHPAIEQQLVFPECSELPPIGQLGIV